MSFQNRREAGAALADPLSSAYARRTDAIVLGLARGGVPVAVEVARWLDLPIDVLNVRKLGVPWAAEVAFGAIGPGNVRVLNDEIAGRLDPIDMAPVIVREHAELRRREYLYRRGRDPLDLTGRTAILVDDGLATGATAEAAVAVARALSAARVVVAAPVGALQAVTRLNRVADEVVCPVTSDSFSAVSRYYVDFHQISDAEVTRLLA